MDILDLFAVVEALAAHDLVGDACTGKVAFDGGRLGVHAVEDGVVGQMSALFQVLADHIRDVAGVVGDDDQSSFSAVYTCTLSPSPLLVHRVLPLRSVLC